MCVCVCVWKERKNIEPHRGLTFNCRKIIFIRTPKIN